MSILTREANPAVAAVIEIALSAQPMAGQTWRRLVRLCFGSAFIASRRNVQRRQIKCES